MYIDKAKIKIKSGNGGDGIVNFHREKYVPKGGPDGGDGGRGGSIIFKADKGLLTLLDFKYKRKFHAQDGSQGDTNNKSGAKGEDLVVKVPLGTVVRNAKNNAVIADLVEDGECRIVLRGGRGGKGNAFYATPTRQAPNFSQPGQKTKEYEVILELKTIADVGLIGFPNVGKSTLLSVISAAKPKIADYHFTTLSPNLGVVKAYDKSFLVADIPGLIEDAHTGIGLGHEFLRHVERTRLLVHVLDTSGSEGRNPVEDYEKIRHELQEYSPELFKKKEIIAANKMDLPDSEAGLELLREYLPEKEIFPVSGVTKEGIKELLAEIVKVLDTIPKPEPLSDSGEELTELLEDDFIVYEDKEDGVYVVEGALAERLLDSVNLYDFDSLTYFHKMLERHGILDELREKGAKDGDLIRFADTEFDFKE